MFRTRPVPALLILLAGSPPGLPQQLRVTPPVLLSGHFAEVTVLEEGAGPSPVRGRLQVNRHLDAPHAAWSVREGELMAVEPGRFTFQAPAVSAPTRFTFQLTESGEGGGAAGASVLVRPRLQVAMVDGSRQCLVAGSLARLQATRLDDEVPGVLTWASSGFPTGSLAAQGHEAMFTAPTVEAPCTCRIQVTDEAHPSDRGTLDLQVLPALEGLPNLLAETLLPSVLGRDWLAPVPALTRVNGGAGVTGTPSSCLDSITTLAFIDDTAMGDLDRHWLVGTLTGVTALSPLSGTSTPLAGLQSVTALAARPSAAVPGAPSVVFAQSQTGGALLLACTFGDHLLWQTGSCLRGLGADGAVRTLAGSEALDPKEPVFRDGAAAQARLGPITALAMDASGAVFMADSGNGMVRRLALDGTVTTLTELGFRKLGVRRALALSWPGLSGLVLHPRTGDLFVTCSEGLLRVTQAGEATLLLSPAEACLERQASCMVDPHRYLRRFKGLARYQDHLIFIMDGQRVLQAFHPGTGALRLLVGRTGAATRMGPLSAPGLPPEACASLHYASAMAVNGEGSCLVGLYDGLAHLDLEVALAR